MLLHCPKCIKSGDTIGVFSPSSPTTKVALNNMKEYFEKRGYKIKLTENVMEKFGFMAGTPEKKAYDFNSLINDPDIKMIMTATGGKSALHLLPLIDYNAIQHNSKIIVGLSDPSIILNAITGKTGLITFHGPNGYNFGHTSITEFSEKNWWSIITGDVKIPYVYPICERVKVIKRGNSIIGRIFGGHLGTIRGLLGTPWIPNLKDAILFIEEIFTEFNMIDTILAHFRLAGVFEMISGLIVGEPVECNEKSYPQVESLEDVILRNCEGYNFPIMTNVPLGHTDDKITIPIGAQVCMDLEALSIILLESGISESGN